LAIFDPDLFHAPRLAVY